MKHLLTAVLTCAIAACASPQPSTPSKPQVGLSNPASTYCIQQGGRLDLRKDAAGNVGGVCVFNDGRECEEWALFRDHQCVASAALKH
jgi:uncharacterized protein